MSASSNASSTLTRSRIALLVTAGIITGFATYGIYTRIAYAHERSALPGTGLHRSNARAARRRPRNAAGSGPPEEDELPDHVPHDPTEDERTTAEIDVENALNLGLEMGLGTALEDGETVVDDGGLMEGGPWREVPSRPYQRHGQNIVQLLFRVSEDATRRNAYVHRGCACNSCGVVPIRGIRYRCANCADYDLCESCESQGIHIKTHIFYKVKVPAPSFGPRHIQPVWYSGDPDSVLRVLPREVLAKLSQQTGFERPELEAYWEQWTFMANTDWRDDPDDICLAMDRKTFERCLVPSGGYRHSAPSLIFDRMFSFYDTNKDDLIGFPEFLHGIAYRKKKDKWRQIFDGYDIDGDGFVDRKDFLRMFRSYYVLYRQMHRDMLEGMEEQQMSSTEAHRLVSSRQPLSSAFGQDGRYPRAPDPRTGEGKVARPNGDMEIVDGKGVINESSHDHGNREEIFRRDMSGLFNNSNWDRNNNPAYWATLLNPPENMGEMPRVLNNFERNSHRHRDRLLAELLPQNTTVDQALHLARLHDDSDSSYSNDHYDPNVVDESAFNEWPPANINVTSEDVQAVAGSGISIGDVQPVHRRAIITQAIFRESAHKDVYERWQRRHFYTDEEEGAMPPEDWKDEDDVLANARIMGESSKATRPVHSRSSSKVRFAEELDDFDTRSNPSTSSRSVPERWGGIDIPDAEKDAGKEILYQVTQQAFNELLDPLFKEKEDLAIESVSTQKRRDECRSRYTESFVAWAKEKEAEENKKREEPTKSPQEPTITPIWPDLPEVELEDLRQRPLEDLLAATGFQVEINDDQEMPQSVPLPYVPIPDLPQTSVPPSSTLPESHEARHTDSEEVDPTPTPVDLPPTPLFDIVSTTEEEGNLHQRSPVSDASRFQMPVFEPDPYVDLTMPQFRPNGPTIPFDNGRFCGELFFITPPSGAEMTHARRMLSRLFRGCTTFVQGPGEQDRPELHKSGMPEWLYIGKASAQVTFLISEDPQDILWLTRTLGESWGDLPYRCGHASDDESGQDDKSEASTKDYTIAPRDRLYKLWKVDEAAKEAEERRGWGKLNFEEFESLVKRFVREGKGNQMDYLGSWIDLCIP